MAANIEFLSGTGRVSWVLEAIAMETKTVTVMPM